MQKISYRKFIPGIAWFFVILLLICLPGKDVPQVGWLDSIPNFDKVVHAGLFGVLDTLLCWPFSKSLFNNKQRIRYFIYIAIAISLWGLTTELIQKYLVVGRDFDLLDWAADSFGVLLAFLFCFKKFR